MTPPHGPQALYYPFHLCHPDTVTRLLSRFAAVHFRDFMALQLTSMSGMTAFHERMGADFPDLLLTGRLVQGYQVSGSLAPELITAINRDLADTQWRRLFHESLCTNRRFQRGLFDLTHQMSIGTTTVPGPHALLQLMEQNWARHPFCVKDIQRLSRAPHTIEQDYQFEYGLALLKTSASLVYTDRLAMTHRLMPATDSPAHFSLFERTRQRDHLTSSNHLIVREGY